MVQEMKIHNQVQEVLYLREHKVLQEVLNHQDHKQIQDQMMFQGFRHSELKLQEVKVHLKLHNQEPVHQEVREAQEAAEEIKLNKYSLDC